MIRSSQNDESKSPSYLDDFHQENKNIGSFTDFNNIDPFEIKQNGLLPKHNLKFHYFISCLEQFLVGWSTRKNVFVSEFIIEFLKLV